MEKTRFQKPDLGCTVRYGYAIPQLLALTIGYELHFVAGFSRLYLAHTHGKESRGVFISLKLYLFVLDQLQPAIGCGISHRSLNTFWWPWVVFNVLSSCCLLDIPVSILFFY